MNLTLPPPFRVRVYDPVPPGFTRYAIARTDPQARDFTADRGCRVGGRIKLSLETHHYVTSELMKTFILALPDYSAWCWLTQMRPVQ